MCYGYDGEAALRRSLEEKGTSRRGLLRGAVVGAAATATLGTVGGLAAPASAAKKARAGGGSVQHNRISIQLYTLRNAAVPPGDPTKPFGIGWEKVLERVAQYGYERVELAGLYGQSAATVKAKLDSLGLAATSSHEGIANDAAALSKKLDNANTLGQRYMVVPYLNSALRSDWEKWAAQMNTEAAAARGRGLRYGYHNHAHEFTIDLGGGVTPWDILTDNLDPTLVHLEADLYWVYTGGVNSGESDPLKFTNDVIRQAPQEVRQYHVKDRDSATGDMCDLGTGVIDFTKIFSRHQVEEYIVENDTPDVTPLTSAAVGHLYLDHVTF